MLCNKVSVSDSSFCPKSQKPFCKTTAMISQVSNLHGAKKVVLNKKLLAPGFMDLQTFDGRHPVCLSI